MTTPVTVAMIQALTPLGLKAVEDALLSEVAALAGRRYARDDGRPEVLRWGAQRGSPIGRDVGGGGYDNPLGVFHRGLRESTENFFYWIQSFGIVLRPSQPRPQSTPGLH